MACRALPVPSIVLLSSFPTLTVAPRGELDTLEYFRRQPWACVLHDQERGGHQTSIEAMAMVAAAAAAGAAGALMCRRVGTPGVPRKLSSAASSSAAADSKGGTEVASPIKATLDDCDGPSDSEDFESSGDEVEETEAAPTARGGANSTATVQRKLWSTQQFPEGTKGAAINSDLANLKAAQEWECPCKDRKSCISVERVGVLELYEHRKAFRCTAVQHSGLRDAMRLQLQAHHDKRVPLHAVLWLRQLITETVTVIGRMPVASVCCACLSVRI